MSGRIGIDFSTPQKISENWPRLVRLIYGKPEFQKPSLGEKPSYVDESIQSFLPAKFKLETYKNAVNQNSADMNIIRTEFIEACISNIDELRLRNEPEKTFGGQQIVDIYQKLVVIRNLIVDWFYFEVKIDSITDTDEQIVLFFEQIINVCSRPKEVSRWNDNWYAGHKIFKYEILLYTIAILLKTQRDDLINVILSTSFLNEKHQQDSSQPFCDYTSFRVGCDALHEVLKPSETSKYYSPVMELVKRNTNRGDLSFQSIIEADAICLFYAFSSKNLGWFPLSFYYHKEYDPIPIFVKAIRKRDFHRLETITGIDGVDALKNDIISGIQRINPSSWHDIHMWDGYEKIFKLDELDTL